MDEDWNVLLGFLPSDWRELAQRTGALKGLRKNKSAQGLLRTLLLHPGGCSLRHAALYLPSVTRTHQQWRTLPLN